jgi:hypothetical protein
MDRATTKTPRFTTLLLVALLVAMSAGWWAERRSYRLERDSLTQQLQTLETQNSHAAAQLASLREQVRSKLGPETPGTLTDANEDRPN